MSNPGNFTTTIDHPTDNVVKIRKTHPDGSEASALIVLAGMYVLVITESHRVREPLHVSYLRMFTDLSEAHDKWLHLIGKLAIKDIRSKYFDKPIYEEHLLNGNDDSMDDQHRKAALFIANYYSKTYR